VRVLVAGGAGYVGSHAAHCLSESGFTPVIYDNLSTGFVRQVQGLEVIEGDLSERESLLSALKGIDAVMHFAARALVGESFEQPRQYYETNLRGGLNLLNAALDARVEKFVFSSTCAVYGIPATLPIREDTPRLPINPYGATKAAFEDALQSYSSAYGLRFIALRYFNAAGADEAGRSGELHPRDPHLIPRVLRAAAGRSGAITVYGNDYETPDGTCIRDYVHVNDLALAHVKALQDLNSGGASEFINLGTGKGHSVMEVISAAEHITGRQIPHIVEPRRPGDPPVLVACAERARQRLQRQPSRGLSQILQTAWKWLLAN
jgi:UDP-glucose-4-epimerase GalE